MRFPTFALAAALLASPAIAFAEGNAENGKKLFKKKARCAQCHIVDKVKHKIGPTLNGVVGRTAGTAEGFKRYSPAMKKAGAGSEAIVWTVENLDTYLTKPKAFIPKNRMAFPGLKKAEDRADVIAYIQTFSPKPASE